MNNLKQAKLFALMMWSFCNAPKPTTAIAPLTALPYASPFVRSVELDRIMEFSGAEADACGSGTDVEAKQLRGGLAIEDPAARVRAVYRRLAQVRYYRAKAMIRADIPQVKMGDVRAEVEFTAPDQLKIRSTSLALLPKQGFSEFARMITDSSNFTAVDGGLVDLGGRKSQLITIVPGAGMPPDLMLARLWLDERQPLVLRAEMTTRSRGTVQVDYTYGSQSARALPDFMVFRMDVRNLKIPKAMTADLHKSNSSAQGKEDPNRQAVVRVQLTDYHFSR
jgi:hypothetical protein